MAEAAPRSRAELEAFLARLADDLRDVEHLDVDARRDLAELLHELGRAVAATELPPAELEHLAASATHLAKALHSRTQRSGLAGAQDRLEQAVLATQSRAPVLTGIMRRLIDVLTNIGI